MLIYFNGLITGFIVRCLFDDPTNWFIWVAFVVSLIVDLVCSLDRRK